MPHATSTTTKDPKPWPSYFLVRTTGEVVPLIAFDELPPALDLIGVPRSIELEDTIGMLNLGLQKGSSVFYAVSGLGGRGVRSAEREGKVAKTIDQFPHSHKLGPSGPDSPDTTPPTPPNSPDRTVHSSSPISPPPTPSTPRPPPSPISPITPQDTLPTHNHNHNPITNGIPQTQLCRHWCHHGICKWGQQCRYGHIMPMTLSGLQEVGLADWPAWYRELNPGYFASETMWAAHAAGKGRGHRRGRGGPLCGLLNGNENGGSAVGACCGVHGLAGVGNGVAGNGAKAERLRTGNRVVVKERTTGRVMRSEELGEQIIARLKNMERDAKAKATAKAEKEKEKISGTVVMERAQARDTRRWEDENESGSEAAEGGDEGRSEAEERGKVAALKKEVVQGKLVEV